MKSTTRTDALIRQAERVAWQAWLRGDLAILQERVRILGLELRALHAELATIGEELIALTSMGGSDGART